MTEVIGDTDIDLTLLFDFEIELKCESLANDCPNDAAWRWHFKCCDNTVLLCEDCNAISESVHCRSYSIMDCHFCHTRGRSMDYLTHARI